MIKSINAEKAFLKIQHTFMIKILQKRRGEDNSPNMIDSPVENYS